MGQYVRTDMVVQEWLRVNGAALRPAHPTTLDAAQQYLMSGRAWAVPTMQDVSLAEAYRTGTAPRLLPLVLRPWTEYLAISVRGVLTDQAGTVRVSLMEWVPGVLPTDPGTLVGAGTEVLLTQEHLPVMAIPASLADWQEVPWFGAGALGAAVPVGGGQGCIQATPDNDWIPRWLQVTVTDGEVHDIAVRTFVSADEVP